MKKLFLIIGLSSILLGCNHTEISTDESIKAFNLSSKNATVEDSISAMNAQYCTKEIQRVVNDILKSNDCDEFLINNSKIINSFELNDSLYIQVYGLSDFYIESDENLIQDRTDFKRLIVKNYNSSYEVYADTDEEHIFSYIGKLVLNSTVK